MFQLGSIGANPMTCSFGNANVAVGACLVSYQKIICSWLNTRSIMCYHISVWPYGAVWSARNPVKVEVAGSNPVRVASALVAGWYQGTIKNSELAEVCISRRSYDVNEVLSAGRTGVGQRDCDMGELPKPVP